MTLNNKCELSKPFVKFLEHVVGCNPVHTDPAKTDAIKNFPTPQKMNDFQRFKSMVNQMGKFMHGLANLNKPLKQLLKKENKKVWGRPQQQTVKEIKQQLT